MNIFGFSKMRGIWNNKKCIWKNLLSFAFEKYFLYNKHGKRRIHFVFGRPLSKCKGFFFITNNIELGNKIRKNLQEEPVG